VQRSGVPGSCYTLVDTNISGLKEYCAIQIVFVNTVHVGASVIGYINVILVGQEVFLLAIEHHWLFIGPLASRAGDFNESCRRALLCLVVTWQFKWGSCGLSNLHSQSNTHSRSPLLCCIHCVCAGPTEITIKYHNWFSTVSLHT